MKPALHLFALSALLDKLKVASQQSVFLPCLMGAPPNEAEANPSPDTVRHIQSHANQLLGIPATTQSPAIPPDTTWLEWLSARLSQITVAWI